MPGNHGQENGSKWPILFSETRPSYQTGKCSFFLGLFCHYEFFNFKQKKYWRQGPMYL